MQCLSLLKHGAYWARRLDDTKREDITFIAFQIWVLGMSIAAV
jgi:hypothetical protein